MVTNRILKTLALPVAVALGMFAASCSNDDNILDEQQPSAAKYEIPVTVSATRSGDDASTRAVYDSGSKKLTFEEGDQLFIQGTDETAGTFAGLLSNTAGAASTFSGTLTTANAYTGTFAALFGSASSLTATLLPKDYSTKVNGYLTLSGEGASQTLSVDATKAFVTATSAAAAKKLAIEQLSLEQATTYSSGTGFALAPVNAVLNYTLSGLTASTSIDVTVSDGTTTVSGSVSTNSSGVATFAVGYAGEAGSKTYTVSTSGKDDDAVTASLKAKKVYNVTRFMYPVGAIHGQFTVSSGKKVCFSKGNLQYIGSAATPYWKLADNQWNYLSTNGSDATNVDRDLFGWGTSGSAPSGQTARDPYYTTQTNTDYVPNITTTGASWGENSEWDWGHNAISNGGNTADVWRTLTGGSGGEWEWILGPYSSPNPGTNCRTSSNVGSTENARWVKATVHSTKGLIIFPDAFTWNDVMGTAPTTCNNVNDNFTYSPSDDNWSALEAAGAVFLPAAGLRDGTDVVNVGSDGYYWSSTANNAYYAYYLNFYSSNVYPALNIDRCYGLSVRLVQNLN